MTVNDDVGLHPEALGWVGWHDDMTSAQYHADPVPGGSLSSTAARKLIPPAVPARVEYELAHRVESTDFDLGHAAHTLVLGKGDPLVEIDATDWRRQSTKDAAAAAREEGKVPLLTHQMAAARAMADAVLTHPVAGPLFVPGTFVPERVAIWHAWHDVMCRAMFDRAPLPGDNRRPLIVDLKTTSSGLDDASLAKTTDQYRYDVQAIHYLDGAKTLGVDPDDVAFLFAFVEKTPPHLVRVVELAYSWHGPATQDWVSAIARWCECRATGSWPGYPDEIGTIQPPKWR